MGYEVPQEIQHKEIIIFNLTWKQLLIATITLIPCMLLISQDFKSTTNYVIIIFIILLGLGFMFLDFDKKIKAYINFRKFSNVTNNSKKMKDFLNIKDISEDTILLRSKSFNQSDKLSVVKVEPTNILMKSKDERDAVSYGFQKFLNSFDFPIQFLVTSVEKDKIFYKKFYVIIPEKYDLGIQTSLVIKEVKSLGLEAKKLNSYEVVELFNNYFSNNQNKEEIDFKELKKDFVHYLVSPSKIENNKDYLFFDDVFARTILVIGYPRTVSFGFLDKIIKVQNNITISVHVEPFSIEKLTIRLNRELQKQRADLYSISQKGSTNPILEIKHNDTKHVLEELQKGEEKLFLISFYVMCKAKSKEELDKLSQTIITELNSILIIPEVPKYLQAQALKTCLPLCQNLLECKRNITTKPLSAFFPFTSKFYNQDINGILFGINENKSPIIKNIFLLPNHNGVILSSSGGGKSYLTKLLIQRYNRQGIKTFIIDPEGEYTTLTKALQGQVINIGLNETNVINPLDLMGHDLKNKKLSLIELFSIMFPDMSDLQKSILDKAINYVYQQSPNPVIKDIYGYLEKEGKKVKNIYEINIYSALLYRLSLYSEGSFSFLNQQTNIDIKNNLVCFHLKNLPSSLQSIMTYLIMSFLNNQMNIVQGKKLLFIDEAWTLLSRSDENSLLFRIIKTCRKHKMGIFLITQEAEDLLSNKAGRSLLTNSSINILLRQRPNVINQLKDVFNLNEEEKYILLNSSVGNGIMIFNNDREQVTITASEEEHELNELQVEKEQKEEINQKELYKSYYYKYSELNIQQRLYLANNGYVLGDIIPVDKQKSEKIYVKKVNNESPEHTFYVHNIKDYLKRFTDKIWLYESQKPDIVFEITGKKYALEIETTKNITDHKKRIVEKATSLNKEYSNNWYFIVLDSRYNYIYEKYGKIINRSIIMTKLQELASPEASFNSGGNYASENKKMN